MSHAIGLDPVVPGPGVEHESSDCGPIQGGGPCDFQKTEYVASDLCARSTRRGAPERRYSDASHDAQENEDDDDFDQREAKDLVAIHRKLPAFTE